MIAVLLIVIVLAVVLLEFSFETRLGLRIAINRYRSRQALCCAEAGVNIAIAALKERDWREADEAMRKLLSGATRVAVGDGYCTVRVTSENGKININGLVNSSGGFDRRRVDQLLRVIDALNERYGEESPVSYAIVPAMIDWIDSDDEVTYLPFVSRENEGAERGYYRKLPTPYKCKNAPFDTLSEVLLVKGMTKGVFEGRPGDAESGVRPVSGMKSFLTVYGDGKVDINHAPATVLQGLSSKIDSGLAEAIVIERRRKPFESVADLRSVPGMTTAAINSLRGLATVKPGSRYYRVVATGEAGGIERKVEIALQRAGDGDLIALLRKEI